MIARSELFNAGAHRHSPVRPADGRLIDQRTLCVAEKVGAVLGKAM